jgi:hypothetical protein
VPQSAAWLLNGHGSIDDRSYDNPNMKADDSVDLFIGPKAPKGLESNWIPTQGKRPLPVMRLYGGDDAFWDKSFKMPDVDLVD